MSSFSKSILAAAIAAASFGAQAAAKFELLAPPANLSSVSGLSAGGASGVTTIGGNYYIAPDRSLQDIGGLSSYDGFGRGLGISADGRYISGPSIGTDGTAQASRYDRTTGSWTALGSLGDVGQPIGNTGISQSSTAIAMSADGSTVVGGAYNTSGQLRAVVYKNGSVVQLAPSISRTGAAIAVNGDGSVITGYTGGFTANGTIWRWNAATSGYDSIIPTATNPWDGTPNIRVTVDAVSPNGLWGAGRPVLDMAKNFAPPFTFPSNTYSHATFTNLVTGQAKVIPFDHVLDTSPGSTDIVRNMTASISGISDAGTVIGTYNICLSCTTSQVATDAWIYFDSTGTTMSFDSYLASIGQPLSPTQHVYSLSSMSADGTAIAGLMFDTATQTTNSFIVSGISPVPEPGQWLLLALGLPLLLARRLRRSEG